MILFLTQLTPNTTLPLDEHILKEYQASPHIMNTLRVAQVKQGLKMQGCFRAAVRIIRIGLELVLGFIEGSLKV